MTVKRSWTRCSVNFVWGNSMKVLEYFENIELYLIIVLIVFILWLMRNTVKYYKGEKRKIKHLHRFAKEGEEDSQYKLAQRFQKGNMVKRTTEAYIVHHADFMTFLPFKERLIV